MHIECAKDHCKAEGVELLPPVCMHWKPRGIYARIFFVLFGGMQIRSVNIF